jgi:hypothetical protein
MNRQVSVTGWVSPKSITQHDSIRRVTALTRLTQMAFDLNDIVPINPNSPRKHTEKHGIFIKHVDIFRVIPWLFTVIRA